MATTRQGIGRSPERLLAGQTPDEIRAWLRTFAAYDPEAWEHVSVDGFAFHFPRGLRVDAQWLQAVFGGSAHPA